MLRVRSRSGDREGGRMSRQFAHVVAAASAAAALACGASHAAQQGQGSSGPLGISVDPKSAAVETNGAFTFVAADLGSGHGGGDQSVHGGTFGGSPAPLVAVS